MTEDEKLVLYLGKQFRAVVEVAADLEEIGDLKVARTQAEEAFKKAREEATIASGAVLERDQELLAVNDAVKVAKKAAKDVLFAADAKAKDVVAAAEVRAGGMIAVANKAVDALKHKLGILEQDHVDVIKKYAEEQTAAYQKTEAILAELAAVQKRLNG